MNEFDSADFLEKISKIICLGEAGKLRRVVQANVNDFRYASLQQSLEKCLRGSPRKADCRNPVTFSAIVTPRLRFPEDSTCGSANETLRARSL